MSSLLQLSPFAERRNDVFLRELAELTAHHLAGCPEYAHIWSNWRSRDNVASFPFLHVGAFKSIRFKTNAVGIKHQRVLKSSATYSGISSQILLDQRSGDLQGRSSAAILTSFLGAELRPLIVLDSAGGLRSGTEVTARIAAALTLKPLALDIFFLLKDSADPKSAKWDQLLRFIGKDDTLLVYGFTHMLWTVWMHSDMPSEVSRALWNKRIDFVHSGGWKKLENERVGREQFDKSLTACVAPGSRVIDFYGLVEQVGVIYPLCSAGYRHVPVWADALVREPWTLEPLESVDGQLQLINLLAWGAPYHNVLTEDIGRIVPGDCVCGRKGKRFEFVGRIPKAEVRGCANV
jgi:hypothetical protein